MERPCPAPLPTLRALALAACVSSPWHWARLSGVGMPRSHDCVSTGVPLRVRALHKLVMGSRFSDEDTCGCGPSYQSSKAAQNPCVPRRIAARVRLADTSLKNRQRAVTPREKAGVPCPSTRSSLRRSPPKASPSGAASFAEQAASMAPGAKRPSARSLSAERLSMADIGCSFPDHYQIQIRTRDDWVSSSGHYRLSPLAPSKAARHRVQRQLAVVMVTKYVQVVSICYISACRFACWVGL